jgi:hypothetical protein
MVVRSQCMREKSNQRRGKGCRPAIYRGRGGAPKGECQRQPKSAGQGYDRAVGSSGRF